MAIFFGILRCRKPIRWGKTSDEQLYKKGAADSLGGPLNSLGIAEPEASQPVPAVYAIGHTMGIQNSLDNGQANACSLPPSGLVLAALVTLPDDGAVLLRDGLPGIDYPHQTAQPVFPHRDRDRLPVFGVIDGVIEQVAHHLTDFQGVYPDVQFLVWAVKRELEMVFLGDLLTVTHLILHDLT